MASVKQGKRQGKVNKSEWIRAQPESMSAAEIIEKAAKEGMTLAASQVYTARKKPGSAPKGKKGKKGSAPSDTSQVAQFIELAFAIGVDKALKMVTALN